jgi:hypothetical protein
MLLAACAVDDAQPTMSAQDLSVVDEAVEAVDSFQPSLQSLGYLAAAPSMSWADGSGNTCGLETFQDPLQLLCPGDEDCDVVVMSASCELFPEASSLHICAARVDDGWGRCQDVLEIDEHELWPLVTEALGYDGDTDLSLPSELQRCFREVDSDTMSSFFEISPTGLQFFDGWVNHTACANPDYPGVWGGDAPRGSVSMPILESCTETLTDAGWNVSYDERMGGAVVETSSFVLSTVATGRLSDLQALLPE